jgi:2-polyprenyl-3-methyl-5-hydroxy-6-metoxy-1,4-benzoquinol methylase
MMPPAAMTRTRGREAEVAVDPEGHEIDALLAFAPGLSSASVLEVGCGDGRLTWRYAPKARRVLAIDPRRSRIARARRNLPPPMRSRVTFKAIGLERLSSRHGPFDVALMSWSL